MNKKFKVALHNLEEGDIVILDNGKKSIVSDRTLTAIYLSGYPFIFFDREDGKSEPKLCYRKEDINSFPRIVSIVSSFKTIDREKKKMSAFEKALKNIRVGDAISYVTNTPPKPICSIDTVQAVNTEYFTLNNLRGVRWSKETGQEVKRTPPVERTIIEIAPASIVFSRKY